MNNLDNTPIINSTSNESKNIFANIFTNIHEVNLNYNIDYLMYKKKLNKYIIKDIDIIYDFFNKEICNNLINIYILKKKYKIDEINFKLFHQFYKFAKLLDSYEFIDQEELFDILLYLYNIYISLPYINNFLENYKFKELIDFSFIEKFNNIFILISKSNILYCFFEKIINHIEEKHIIYEFEIFGKLLSYDFFMYYNCEKIMEKIINSISEINIVIDNINISNINKKIHKYKNYFYTEYYEISKKHLEIYNINELDLKVKFKINKSRNISNFIKELEYIDSFT